MYSLDFRIFTLLRIPCQRVANGAELAHGPFLSSSTGSTCSVIGLKGTTVDSSAHMPKPCSPANNTSWSPFRYRVCFGEDGPG